MPVTVGVGSPCGFSDGHGGGPVAKRRHRKARHGSAGYGRGWNRVPSGTVPHPPHAQTYVRYALLAPSNASRGDSCDRLCEGMDRAEPEDCSLSEGNWRRVQSDLSRGNKRIVFSYLSPIFTIGNEVRKGLKRRGLRADAPFLVQRFYCGSEGLLLPGVGVGGGSVAGAFWEATRGASGAVVMALSGFSK